MKKNITIKEIIEEFDRNCFNDDGWNMRMYSETKGWLVKTLTTLTQHHEAEVERALEDVGNYVDELYQNGNMDKMQAEMICEYIDGKLPAPTKTDDQQHYDPKTRQTNKEIPIKCNENKSGSKP